MAMLGWGTGFYGPPVFLHAVVQRTGWPLAWVSAAVTVHFLVGALVVTRLPRLHARFGVGPVALAGSAVTALGVLGWSLAATPPQLLAAAAGSGAGWVTLGAAAVNAALAPWYERGRPLALARAYNGASIGGLVFSPLWVWLIGRWGFTAAAALVGALMVATMALLARAVFAHTPQRLGQAPDGDTPAAPSPAPALADPAPLPAGRALWRDRRFATLALGMAAGLFAQIGLLAHLYALLVPALGAGAAGLAMGLGTGCAIVGRLVAARAVQAGARRRAVAAAAYGVQLAAVALLALGDGGQAALVLLGVALFGSGIGNATSLPPLIAQAEFARADVPRAVATLVAFAQASYAFAPAAFGLVLAATAPAGARIGGAVWAFLLAVALVQALAMACLLGGRGAR
ncbi:MAG: MFS transporter [Rubrivivax sp.]